MAEKKVQRFDLEVDGRRHHVEVVVGAFTRTTRWFVDDELVATKTSADDRLKVSAGDGVDDAPEGLGDLGVRFSVLGKPLRATWYADGAGPKELAGLGGIDLEPEPDSPAARHEERVRAHPQLYAAQRAGGGVLAILVPLLLAAVAFRWAAKIPWPHLSLPFPDIDLPLPSVPWPDLPSVSLPDWHVPGWLEAIGDAVGTLWPVIVAIVIAVAEIRRRRTQDRLREQRRSGEGGA